MLQRINKYEVEQELNDRWGWLCEDIENSNSRLDTMIYLENSYKEMVKQNLLPQNFLTDLINEEILTEAPQNSKMVGDYVIPKIMFPLIRRVMPELFATKLVSTQPLQAPTGIIYYITYNYSNTKGEITKGDEFSAAPQQTTPGYATWYTSEKIGPFNSGAAVEATDLVVSSGNKITEFLGTSVDEFTIKRFEVYNLNTGKAVPVIYNPSGSGSTISYNLANGNITIAGTLIEEAPDPTTGRTGAKPIAEGDLLRVFLVYDQESSKKIPEMEFGINYMTAQTQERKMKIRWTKEAEQDFQAYHKIDVEDELVKATSIQMDYEIDRQVIRFIDDTIITELSYMHDWANDVSGTGGNNTHGNYLDRHRALAQKIYFASTQIAAFNHLGAANWAVVSPQVAALLFMLPEWKSGEISGTGKQSFYNAGYLGNGNIAVYVDPNRVGAQASEITLGFKSNDETFGAGVVFSPYASWVSNTITHPENFDSIRGFFNRYALTRTPRSEYNYGKLIINNYLG